ncbi:MAG: hypothetical protein V4604_04560 [Bacteroidota bacterium]
MKPLVKKPLTAKNKWLLVITTILAVGVIIGFMYWTSIKAPTWKYVQSFQDNRYLTCVDKTFKKYKNSQEDFFLIHTYDFNTNKYNDAIKVPIPEGLASQSEYIGYSDRYIWISNPYLTAVDMLSPTHEVLDFDALKKRICSKNPGDFKDLLDLKVVEEYMKATNQNGDQFFVNIETFSTSQTPPVPYYDAHHKIYSVTDQLPLFLPGSDYSERYHCEATLGNIDYNLKPIDENNPIKCSFFSSPNNGPDQIKVTLTDSSRAAIQDGTTTVITPIPQTQAVAPEETRLTDQSFINAIGLGIVNNRFVFRFQKSIDRQSPWYLGWFDLKTKSVIKEVNLASKGMVIETPQQELFHRVSLDGKWAFFTIDQKKPIRIQL